MSLCVSDWVFESVLYEARSKCCALKRSVLLFQEVRRCRGEVHTDHEVSVRHVRVLGLISERCMTWLNIVLDHMTDQCVIVWTRRQARM